MTTEAAQSSAQVSGTLRLDGLEPEELDALVRRAAELAADLRETGPFRMSRAANQERGPEVDFEGTLLVALKVLEHGAYSGARLFPERSPASLVVVAAPVRSEKVVAINDHLGGASENHPRDDAPLHFRTEDDEAAGRLTLRVSGSLFAASYLAFLCHLQLTQSRR